MGRSTGSKETPLTAAPRHVSDSGPLWLGVPQRPLAAWQHAPQGECRGAVVVCAPMGSEHSSTKRSLRNLALELSGAGFLVVRFDWSGQGNSAPATSPCTLAWQEDLRSIVARIVKATALPVSLVGVRLGALVAAHALESAPEAVQESLQSVALWDPVDSGARFLRQQHALLRAGVTNPPPRDARAQGPGFTLSESDSLALRALRLDPAWLQRLPRVALVHRASDGSPSWANGYDWDVWESTEQERFVDVPAVLAQSPTDTIGTLTQWLLKGSDQAENRPIAAQPHGIPLLGPTVCEVRTPVGVVRESLVQVGSGAMPGVLTEPVEGPITAGLLLLPSSTEPHSGPGGLWTTLAREQAAHHGTATVRVDLPGVGDSGPARQSDPSPYLPAFLDHLSEAAGWLTERVGTRPAGAGICSGAYLLMQRARDFSDVLAINPLVYDDRIEDIPDAEINLVDVGQVAAMAQARTGSRNALRYHLKRRLPHGLWRLTGVLRLGRTPDQLLVRAGRHAHVEIALGEADIEVFNAQRGPEAVRRARRRGSDVTVSVDAALDHAILSAAGRERVGEILDSMMRGARQRSR